MLTVNLPSDADTTAPDGSEVRALVRCGGASMAHFSLAPGQVSLAVAHRTIDELWYFVAGRGEMWRRCERTGAESTVEVGAGVSVAIPNHTHFQFRASGHEPLTAVAVTVPEWPGIGDMSGHGEVYRVEGPWLATVPLGSGPQVTDV